MGKVSLFPTFDLSVDVGVAIEFKNEAWNPEVPEVMGIGLLLFFVSEFIVLTRVGGGEELESSLVKELNNSDIFSLSTEGKSNLLLVGAFCKDSSNWDIWASASAVSRLSWDLKTGGPVLELGPGAAATVIGLNLGIVGSGAGAIRKDQF